jgi:Plant transposon protein
MNDLNILSLSLFIRSTTNGSFGQFELEAGIVPFETANQQFTKMFVLVDGISPKYSRFVRGLSQPVTKAEIAFTSWQEGACKDIERAFGVLQMKWKIINFPIHSINLINVSNLVLTCLILHNMGVSDRVMGDPTIPYVPNYAPPENMGDTHDATNFPGGNAAPATNASANVRPIINEGLATTIAYKTEWALLKDPKEWARLQNALLGKHCLL